MTNTLIHMDREEVLQLEKSLSREWFEFDGLGGYASSTVLMCPTRRYHGLLVTRPSELPARHVFLSRFEESLHGRGKSFPLSMARYPDVISPHGYKSFENFELKPWPTFQYQIGRVSACREILMLRGQRTVLCRYSFRGAASDIELRLRPLLAYRPADALTRENLDLDPAVERLREGFRMRPYPSLPALRIRVGGGDCRFEADPVWYRQLLYAEDIARGYDGQEDNFSPGILHLPLGEEIEYVVACSVEEQVGDPLALWEEESYRRNAQAQGRADDVRATLTRHREDFLYTSASGRKGVIAGYPWFGERGRDTFVALPGLTLAAGDLDGCRDVLLGALPFLRRGLLPSVFGDRPESSRYESADASLWFARAVRLWQKAGGDAETLHQRFLPALEEIATRYSEGTELGIHTTDDGLLWAGDPERCVTWMDSVAHASPLSRHGHAVEVNALWYFLLHYLGKLHSKAPKGSAGAAGRAGHWNQAKKRVAEAFPRRFWIEEQGYLADCVRGEEVDASVRPNQLIAAALEFSPLTREQRLDIVHRAEVALLTPRGMRTLSPRMPSYNGKYTGTAAEREAVSHQGSAWPWLLGFFCEAYLRANRKSKKRDEFVRGVLDGMKSHLHTYGQEQVSELFDGDPPHRAGGAPARAWSTSELLRAYALLEEAGK